MWPRLVNRKQQKKVYQWKLIPSDIFIKMSQNDCTDKICYGSYQRMKDPQRNLNATRNNDIRERCSVNNILSGGKYNAQESVEECAVCSTVTKQNVQGGPKKLKQRHNPANTCATDYESNLRSNSRLRRKEYQSKQVGILKVKPEDGH